MTDLPPLREVPVEAVREALTTAPMFIALDDDPTGTQTVREVPVLTRWTADDVRWALTQDAPGFYILTNTRSQQRDAARARILEIVDVCLSVAAELDVAVTFASRSDSTLRGHFPLEVDAVRDVLAQHGERFDGIILAPAYLDAGRVTLHGEHLIRSGDVLTPVSESEFARDATFGYRTSNLPEWVAEKSGGVLSAADVLVVDVADERDPSGAAVGDRLSELDAGGVAALDAMDDSDLRSAVLGALGQEAQGRRFVYQVGPSFVRSRLGQGRAEPIDDDALGRIVGGAARGNVHGLVVVGSHVGLTSRQLDALRASVTAVDVEIDVTTLLQTDDLDAFIAESAERVASALASSLVVVSTSRTLVRGADAEASLDIARRVSETLTAVVARAFRANRPAFVVAKGGITSSDVATRSLELERAWVRGSLLPGIVSLWQGVGGVAADLPYVVFAGNVGDDQALAAVVGRLERAVSASTR